MDRLKHSGFYKLKFFITPEEFKDVLKLFEQKQAQFSLTNQTQVYETYEKFWILCKKRKYQVSISPTMGRR